MASSTISSELRISLVEDATKQAPKIAAALERVKKEADVLQKALAGSGTSDRLQKSLLKLGAGEAHVEGVANAWRDYARAEGMAEHAGEWTKAQAAAARTWEDAAIKAVRDVKREEAALARARHEQTVRDESEAIKAAQHKAAEEKRLADQAARDTIRAAEQAAAEKRQLDREAERETRRSTQQQARDAHRIAREAAREQREQLRERAREEREAARERARLDHGKAHAADTVAGVASLYAAHSAVHGAERVIERYREYDKERRYEKVVMGLTDEQQRPLVDQAIHGSGDSRYNDVQWLAAQRNLAARGYNREQVLGFTPVTSQLGQAFDLEKMEDGVKLLEGAMLGFKKDVSTKELAQRSAQRTADLEVKSSKISGMNAEDIEQLYKRGAAAARMAGLTEEQMLAFGGAAKKVNIGGDESATAFVSLTKNLLHPTHGALTAMRASGIDFSKYQKIGPVNEDGFAAEVASNFGIKLKSGVRAGLHRIFADPEMMKDPAQFAPAITRMLRRDLQGNDAKSLKSIAGLAGRYRDASATGVDTQGLLTAIMDGLAKNPGLAIALFGSKQAGRISSGLDKDVFAHLLDELKNHSEGFAEKVSDERMSGFDGAMAKLANQVAILETSIGRAFDSEGAGKGGMLTRATEGVGKFVEILGEANPRLLRAGSEAVALAAGFAALKSVGFLRGGFGLKSSASALITSAELLDRAAIKLGATKEAAAAGAAAGAAEPTAAAADATPKAPPKGFLGEGGFKSIPKKIMLGGPAAIAEYLAYQAGTGAIETVTDALPHPKYRDGYDPAKVRDRSLWGDAEAMWTHLRGRRTPEEIAAKRAAEAPIAPAKVPAGAPDDDAADDAEEDGKHPAAPSAKAVSPFLARHPDFKRLDGASSDDADPPIAGKRAGGGPVSRGKTYLVGEHGPELFTAGMNGAISTADVQRMLSKASPATRYDSGDPETAKAIRALGFELAGSVDGVARAVDRLDARKFDDTPGQDRNDAGGGDSDGGGFSGGRRGFMGRGGHFGGRRGFVERNDGGPADGAGSLTDGPVAKFKTGKLFAEKAPQVMARLQRDLGISKVESAAILGNLGHESAGFKAFAEGGHGPGRGWAQWTDPGRKRRFFEYAQRNALDPKSDEANYGFLRWELTHTHKSAIAALKAAGTPEGKMRAFEQKFEGAGVKHYPSRLRYMHEALAAADTNPAVADPDPAPAPTDDEPETGRSASRHKTPTGGDRIVGGANLMSGGHYKGARPGADLTTIKTEDGRRLTVHRDAAPSFKRFLDQLEERGYKVNSLGGYAARGNRSNPGRLSEHAFGNAIDINPSSNPFRSDKTDMPADISRMAAENGLSWGGDWRHKDNMHFEWRGVRPWEKAQAKARDAAKAKAAEKPVGETPTKEDLNRANEDAYRSPQNPFRPHRPDPLGLKGRRSEGEGAGDLHAGLEAIHGKAVAPAIDNSHLHETVALLDHIEQRMGKIHSASAKHRGGSGGTAIAGLSSKLRGGYGHSGPQIG